MNNYYNSWLEVNIDNLSYNINQIKGLIGENCDIMGVVKSNAYGHGLLDIAKHLVYKCNVAYLAVANIWEAIELRNSDITAPILVLGTIVDSHLPVAIENNLTIALYDIKAAKFISEESLKLNKKTKVHIKIDSGLRRIGLRIGQELQDFIEEVTCLPGLNIEGVFTHFADSGALDKTFTYEQLDNFKTAIMQLKENDIYPRYIHCAATQAILEVPESHFNLVRAGKLIYGYHGLNHNCDKIDLKLLLQWKALITNIRKVYAGESIGYSRTFTASRDMTIAVVAVGFGDGYSSLISNKGFVLINGKKAPLVGRVCMDSCFADITDIDNVMVGDEAIIIGEQGNEKIEKMDIFKITGVQTSEVIANIANRVGRIYISNKNTERG